MNTQEQINYNRIAEAIDYIRLNFKVQPSLDDVAKKINLSPFRFQRLFSDWAGISPKKFLQYISLEYAKKLLAENETLSNTAFETGLSGTSRLHDLFINMEGMTPGEYKQGGINLKINYFFSESPFGNILTAATSKGVCYMAFSENDNRALHLLKLKFPNAEFCQKSDPLQLNALSIFKNDWSKLDQIKLHLKGTDFQLKVWESLLKIPVGKLSTYGNIANNMGKPNASRAIGTAIGSNPVAFIIPCHRVIQSTGNLGGYMWGTTRKTAIIGWEQSKFSKII